MELWNFEVGVVLGEVVGFDIAAPLFAAPARLPLPSMNYQSNC